IELFFYIDLLNYMLKYKIPQIVTLTLLLLPLSYGELYKTKIAIISFPMIAITSCTRSGT
ncbi:hypothetical protein POY48_04195, partial [Phocaeicola vulgatus]|nr:hypothetical protein [Phocaeicola vulgatus]